MTILEAAFTITLSVCLAQFFVIYQLEKEGRHEDEDDQ